MKDLASPLPELYSRTLRAYLRHRGEEALQRAHELGRRAMGEDTGLLDLVALHHEALLAVLGESPRIGPPEEVVGAAGTFLSEALSSFEMAQCGFREAVSALRRINEALEEEARRIAHSLHDDAGQLLVAVHLALQAAEKDLPAGARERLGEVRGLLDEMEKHLRRLSHELRPTLLDDLGLVPALEFLAQGVSTRCGIPIAVEGPRDQRLPPRIETALYRVVQEALRNAAKHSRARGVAIDLAVGGNTVRCSVKDDGRGFDTGSLGASKGRRGLGLIGMRERLDALGGELEVDSAPGRGTELRITIPLEGDDADSAPARR